MRLLHRTLPVVATAALAFVAACNDSDPSGPGAGLPDSLDPISVVTAKNTAVEATVPVSTVAGRTLDYQVVAGPSHGAVDLSPRGNGLLVRYTPEQGFGGQDQVTFRVDDGVSTVDGVVNITVTNRAPSAVPLTLRRPVATAVTFTLSGTDPDGDALTFEVVSAPAGGELSGIPGGAVAGSTVDVTYTPDPEFLEDDSFTYRVSDGIDASAPVTVHLPANRLPEVVVDGSVPLTVKRNTATRIVFTIADDDGDAVTPTLGDAPEHGQVESLEQWAGSWRLIYTPDEGYIGADVLTLILDDGFDVIPVEVGIEVVNAAPVAYNASAFGFLGSDILITLTGGDDDGDPLTFEIVTPPASGTLGDPTSVTPTTAQVIYTPADDATEGPQTFTFRVTDGESWSAPATATVQLQTGAPTARPTNATVPGNSSVEITLTGVDQQGDSLHFAIASAPSNGTLGPIVSLGLYTARVTYTPAPGYEGFDLFTFTVFDGTFTSEPATVGISVTEALDSPPVVVDNPVESFTTHTNVPLQVATTRTASVAVFVAGNLLDNFIDLDGDGLEASLDPGSVTAGASVIVTPDGDFAYNPAAGQATDDTFDYVVTDGITPITRTVTVSFDEPIWFVDDSFAGLPQGTVTAPFTTLADASAAAGADEIIVVAAGNSAVNPLDGGFAFQPGQQLLGRQVGLTTTLGTIFGSYGAARPVITNSAGDAITLASGAVLQGIDLQAPTGAGIAAASVAGAVISSVAITDAAGEGIALDAPAGSWNFTDVTVTGSGAGGFTLDGGAATVHAGVEIANTTGVAVEVANLGGGAVTFSGPVAGAGIRVHDNSGGSVIFSGSSTVITTDTDAGVVLADNSGATIAFTGGGLEIETTDGDAFVATGGGTVTVTGVGNRIAASGATEGVRIIDTTIGGAGVAFEQVDVAGASNGIRVTNAGAGTFTVSGNGAPGSGGVITDVTGDGVVVSTPGPVALAQMVIGDSDPGVTGAIGGAGVRVGAPAGAGHLTLSGVVIAGIGGDGVVLDGVETVNIVNSSIGNVAGRGIDIADGTLTGLATLTGTAIEGFTGGGVVVEQSSGTARLSLTDVTLADSEVGSGASGLVIDVSGTGHALVEVLGSSVFERLDGAGIQVDAADAAEFDLTVIGATFTETNADPAGPRAAVAIDGFGTSIGRTAILEGTVTFTGGSGVLVQEHDAATLHTRVDDLTVGTGVAGSGSAPTAVGIGFLTLGTGATFAEVSRSNIRNGGRTGIFSTAVVVDPAADGHLILTDNIVAAPETDDEPGILIQANGPHTICTTVRGNESAGSTGAPGIHADQMGAATFGYSDPGPPVAFVDWLETLNAPSTATSSGTFTQVATGCTAPLPPTRPGGPGPPP